MQMTPRMHLIREWVYILPSLCYNKTIEFLEWRLAIGGLQRAHTYVHHTVVPRLAIFGFGRVAEY